MRGGGGIFLIVNYSFIFVTIVFIIKAYADTTHNFCDGIDHAAYFNWVCCNNEMLEPGIKIDVYWKGCAPPQNETDIPDADAVFYTMWNVYMCIVTSAIKSPATLQSFSETMTSSFTNEDIKTKIMKIVSETQLNAVGDSIEGLNQIRVTYRNIERGVCEGKNIKRSIESLTSCKSDKDTLRENDHLHGGCCQEKQLPLRLTYRRREPTAAIQQCTFDLMMIAGKRSPPTTGTASEDVLQQYQHETLFNKSDSRQICIQACAVIKMENMKMEEDTTNTYAWFNFTQFTLEATDFFPKNVQKQIRKYVLNDTALDIELDWILHYEVDDLISREFSPLVNMSLVRSMLYKCEAHNLITRKIEQSLFEICHGNEPFPPVTTKIPSATRSPT